MFRIAPVAIAVFAIQTVSITPTHSQEQNEVHDLNRIATGRKEAADLATRASDAAERARQLSDNANKAKTHADGSNNQIPTDASVKPTAEAYFTVVVKAAEDADTEAGNAESKAKEAFDAAKRASSAQTQAEVDGQKKAAETAWKETQGSLAKTETFEASARNTADTLARIASRITSGLNVDVENEINELVREFRAEDKAKMVDVARPIRRTIQQKRVADVKYANWVEINGKFYRETKTLSIPYYVDARRLDRASGKHYVGERDWPKYQLVPAADVSAVGGTADISAVTDLKDFDPNSNWVADSSNSDNEANFLILKIMNNAHLSGIVYVANQDSNSSDERPTRLICRVHHGEIEKVENGARVSVPPASIKKSDGFGTPVVLNVSNATLKPKIYPFPAAIRQSETPTYVLLEFPEGQKKISIAELHFFKLNGEDRDVTEESRR